MIVPVACWEINSSFAPFLEDKEDFCYNSVGPRFKTCRTAVPLRCIALGAVHPLDFFVSGCQCVGGPSASVR